MGIGAIYDSLSAFSIPYKLRKSKVTYVLEQTQHFRVRRVVGNRERQVRVAQNSSNPNQSSAATRHNADILPGVLALLSLTVVLIVQTCHGRTQRLDTGGRTVFSGRRGDGDRSRAREASLDLVVGLGGTLA